MKKTIFGIIIGLFIGITGSAYAEEVTSYIGKTIKGQFPVIINGVELEKPGLVLEGTTFVPIRLVADALGQNISFIDSTVILTPKESPIIPNSSDIDDVNSQTGEGNIMIEDNTDRINQLKNKLSEIREKLQNYESLIENFKTKPNVTEEEIKNYTDIRKPIMDSFKTTIAELEQQIADLES
jgi:Mg2+ and Co2+ transporter CorA